MTELEQDYYLIDLERSVGSGVIHYWKPFKQGYTTSLEDAGQYSGSVAKEIEKGDLDKFTVAVSKVVIDNILGKR